MKRFILIAAAALFTTACFATPNQKVLNAFEKTFGKAEQVTWQDVDENYEATFKQNQISYRVMYDADGVMLKSIRYYKGETLPILVQAKLNKKYQGKSVFGVTEVTTENQIDYYIILEDSNTWTHVHSDAYGNLQTEKKLKKA